jgi:hypothetical protein
LILSFIRGSELDVDFSSPSTLPISGAARDAVS